MSFTIDTSALGFATGAGYWGIDEGTTVLTSTTGFDYYFYVDGGTTNIVSTDSNGSTTTSYAKGDILTISIDSSGNVLFKNNGITTRTSSATAGTNSYYAQYLSLRSGSGGFGGTLTSKPTDIQDNSIFVETDTARRYWLDGSTWTMEPTWRDDFSSDGWTDADATNIGVAGGVLHAIGKRDGTNDASYIDIGATLSDTAWIMRFKASITSAIQGGSGNSILLMLVLSDSTGSTSVSQDSIQLGWEMWSAGNTIGINSNESAVIPWISSGTSLTTNSVRTDYFELIRNSSTLITANQYSDSTYSTLVNSVTRAVTEATGGLRYLKCTNKVDTGGDSTIIIDIDDVEIYDGVTSIT